MQYTLTEVNVTEIISSVNPLQAIGTEQHSEDDDFVFT